MILSMIKICIALALVRLGAGRMDCADDSNCSGNGSDYCCWKSKCEKCAWVTKYHVSAAMIAIAGVLLVINCVFAYLIWLKGKRDPDPQSDESRPSTPQVN